LYREAERLDVLSNTIEAARYPIWRVKGRGAVPSESTLPADKRGPSSELIDKTDFVDKYEDETELALNAIQTGVNRFIKVLDMIKVENPDVSQKIEKYRSDVESLGLSAHQKLKDILLRIIEHKGGLEMATHSVDRRGA